MWNKILINKIADLGIGCLQVINHCIDLDTLMLSSICVDLALRGLSKHSKHFALVNTTPYVKGIVATNLMAKATAAPFQQNGQLTTQFFTGLVGITYLMHNDINDITHVHTQITFKDEHTENTPSNKEPSVATSTMS